MHDTAPEPLIFIAEAARRLGIDRSVLSRQIANGSVRSHGGKVRYSEVLADRAANIDLSRSSRHKGLTEAEERPGASPVDATPDTPVGPDRADADADADADAEGGYVLVDGRAMPLKEARALKETYLARLRQQEFEVKAGTLVDRAAAEKAFFEESRVMRDAWMAWPARIAIEAAEEIKIDPQTGMVDPRSLVMVLNGYVRQHLMEMGEPDTDLPGV